MFNVKLGHSCVGLWVRSMLLGKKIVEISQSVNSDEGNKIV